MAGTAWTPGAPVLDGIAIGAPWLAAAVLMICVVRRALSASWRRWFQSRQVLFFCLQLHRGNRCTRR